ncbi:MAG: GntR family transcriptional regulator [Prevotella sp.]|nr:GntR family transcriptional regulator [Prevotella sp.]
MKLLLGDYNTLRIARRSDIGLYLDGDQAGEILLPNRYVTQDMQIGDETRVFLYLDQEERLVATTEQPLAKVGDFACLECVWVNQYGAFLDWGLMKNLFCPFREQRQRMETGRRYIVHVHIDQDSYRIMASAKVSKFLSTDHPPYQPGDEANILVWQPTDMGYKVIVDNRYYGLIFRNQVFQPIHTGDRLKAYISNVREDGKLDIALQHTGRQHTQDFAEELLAYLHDHNGICSLGDKSDADDIRDTFHVSKKTFKRAVGDLYKRHLVMAGDYEVRLK